MEWLQRGKEGQAEQLVRTSFVTGVETEAPLAVCYSNVDKDGDYLAEQKEALNELATWFQLSGLDVYPSVIDHERDYHRWAITIDPSIDSLKELPDKFPSFIWVPFSHLAHQTCIGIVTPIEIKSPKITIDDDSPDQAGFHTMWDIIGPMKLESIEYWKMVNNNIHFSLTGHSEFPIEAAQLLAFCIIYFEKAIDDIIPALTHRADRKRPQG
jgi:hypothetical protein